MLYSEFVEVYEKLDATSKRLEKVTILAGFLKKIAVKGQSEWTYLLMGRVLPDYDSREFGISGQLTIKAIGYSLGIDSEEIVQKYNKIGDLGLIAEEFIGRKKQAVLFSSKLQVKKVYDNLRKLVDLSGKGVVDKKMILISELLGSVSGLEAKYIVRTLLSDLRIGVAKGILRDALAEAFFLDDKDRMADKIEVAYDLANDFALVFNASIKGEKALEEISVTPGIPMNVMLAVKAESIEEAFEVCGKPAALEYKYDGFRMLINGVNGKISLFTRKLENVTNQFPDVVAAVKKFVKGKSFILDSEVVGYDSITKKYKPFEAVSQRIRRKYDIDKLVNELPVEVNVFDVIYHDGKVLMNKPLVERRKVLEKIIDTREKVIKPAIQIITGDSEEAMRFYETALEVGEEGIMVKKLDAPYRQGRRVGYMVKLKPVVNDLDLVIVGAEYGSGKRAGWLSSFIVACKDNGKFLEVGKVSSGLKEKESEGTSYDEITKLLKPLIVSEEANGVKVKPKLVVAVTYQNIQKSPSYSSGYALRFPRISHYRPDKDVNEIATLKDIEKEVSKNEK